MKKSAEYLLSLNKQFSKPPIIICGCARSGTTLLLSVLSAHPCIFGIPFETKAFCFNAYEDDPKRECIDLETIYNYFMTQVVPEGSRWCEKTPKNVLFIKEILDFFDDNVRIINIVRDGRDVICSRHPENPECFWVAPERWIADVKAGLSFSHMPQVMTVRYEDLIRFFLPTMRNICHFLGEEWCNEFISWHEFTKIKHHEAWFDGAKPIYCSSIGTGMKIRHRHRVKVLMRNSEAVALLKHFNYIH